jgi:hypothetical protein
MRVLPPAATITATTRLTTWRPDFLFLYEVRAVPQAGVLRQESPLLHR